MRRRIEKYLSNWLTSKNRKPMIMRGARQVGKTWIVRQLVKENRLHLLEFNFERLPEQVSLFKSNDPKQILLNIEASNNSTIYPEKSLLFLDEIQAAPELIAKLRWFAEEMPELRIIAAGSLLEFVLKEHTFSMPVGRIEYCHLEPLSFFEFLEAQGKINLLEFMYQININTEIPELIHNQLKYLFKEYLIIGGMPEAVQSWVNEKSLSSIHKIHQNLIATFRDDFHKYAHKSSITNLNEILIAIPRLLGKKFVFSHVKKDVQASSLKNALNILARARVCHVVHATAGNTIPLAAEIKQNFFKVLFLDVGLASAVLKLNLINVQSFDTLTFAHQGGLSEQIAGQLIRTLDDFYIEPELFYWLREQKGTQSEIDFLIQYGPHIIPVEVKSGTTGSLKSLHLFMQLKKLPTAVRINMDFPSVTKVETKLHDGCQVGYTLLSIPFYLIEQLPKLIKEMG